MIKGNTYLLSNATIYTGDSVLDKTSILVKEGKITELISHSQAILQNPIDTNTQRIDLKGRFLSAGLIDIQINGGYSYYFSEYPSQYTIASKAMACH